MSKLKYAMNFLADVPACLFDKVREFLPEKLPPLIKGQVYARDLKPGMCLLAYDWILDPSINIGNSVSYVWKVDISTELYQTKVLKLWKRFESEVKVELMDGRIFECDPYDPVDLYVPPVNQEWWDG